MPILVVTSHTDRNYTTPSEPIHWLDFRFIMWIIVYAQKADLFIRGVGAQTFCCIQKAAEIRSGIGSGSACDKLGAASPVSAGAALMKLAELGRRLDISLPPDASTKA